MLTKAEIIKQTAEYYAENPLERRSLDGYSCVYNNTTGKKCAFAFWCKDPTTLIEKESADWQIDKFGIGILKDEAQIEDKEFWNDVQEFHDYSLNWTAKGLSDSGESTYKILLEKYKTIN